MASSNGSVFERGGYKKQEIHCIPLISLNTVLEFLVYYDKCLHSCFGKALLNFIIKLDMCSSFHPSETQKLLS